MIFTDLETRSTASLPTVGGRNYAEDPSTSIMCVGWSFDDQMWVHTNVPGLDAVWQHCIPEQELLDVECRLVSDEEARERLEGEDWCAHNADGFDRHVWGQVMPWGPARWLDSLHWARLLGLPGRLDALGQYLLDVGKHEGRDITLQLSKPRKAKRGPQFIPLTPANMPAVIQYLIMDVIVMRAAVEREILPLLREIPPFERRVLQEDRVINNRGCVLDDALARRLIDIELEMRAKRGETIADILPAKLLDDRKGNKKWNDMEPPERARSFLRQPHSIKTWLFQDFDICLENLQKDTVLELIDDAETPGLVRQVLEARLGECRITTAKLVRALEIVGRDGRLRDMLIYYGAQTTGRWSGTKMQLHNLPRPVKLDVDRCLETVLESAQEDTIAALLDLLKDTPFTVSDLISTLLRLCIVAPDGKVLFIGDFASVEARGLPWLARDDSGLEVFWRGEDAYIAQAAKLTGSSYADIDQHPDPKERGRLRSIGKIAVLACGYGMGPDKLADFASGMGIDLAEVGVSPQFVINGWRDANPAIAGTRTGEFFDDRPIRTGGFWRDLEWAFKKTILYGAKSYVGRVILGRHGPHTWIELPSRRKLWYRNARIEKMVPVWGGDPRDTLVYEGWRRGAMRDIVTYGGKLAENVTQAACRDLMAHALLALADAGLPVVVHVHDEAVAEIENDEDVFRRGVRAMSTPPSWADGFPLEVEAFTSDRYRKDPPSGAMKCRALNGVIHE